MPNFNFDDAALAPPIIIDVKQVTTIKASSTCHHQRVAWLFDTWEQCCQFAFPGLITILGGTSKELGVDESDDLLCGGVGVRER